MLGYKIEGRGRRAPQGAMARQKYIRWSLGLARHPHLTQPRRDGPVDPFVLTRHENHLFKLGATRII
jgi:hypothetical protein